MPDLRAVNYEKCLDGIGLLKLIEAGGMENFNKDLVLDVRVLRIDNYEVHLDFIVSYKGYKVDVFNSNTSTLLRQGETLRIHGLADVKVKIEK